MTTFAPTAPTAKTTLDFEALYIQHGDDIKCHAAHIAKFLDPTSTSTPVDPEDVLQEVFLSALTSSPSEGSDIYAWLLGITLSTVLAMVNSHVQESQFVEMQSGVINLQKEKKTRRRRRVA